MSSILVDVASLLADNVSVKHSKQLFFLRHTNRGECVSRGYKKFSNRF